MGACRQEGGLHDVCPRAIDQGRSGKEMNQPWRNRIISSGVKPASDYLAHELNWKRKYVKIG